MANRPATTLRTAREASNRAHNCDRFGTVIRADTLHRYATDAGFTGFERLDEPALDMLRFYRLTS